MSNFRLTSSTITLLYSCNGDIELHEPTTNLPRVVTPAGSRPNPGEVAGYTLMVVILVLLLVGGGWSYVRRKNRSDTPRNIFGRLHVSYRRNRINSWASDISLRDVSPQNYTREVSQVSNSNGVLSSYQFGAGAHENNGPVEKN